MKRLLAALLAWLWLAPALAQVSPIIIGTNIGGDPTITSGFPYATGPVPYQTNFVRVYDAIRGATAHATWWSTLNPTAGNYTFAANLDPILNTLAARNQASEYTLSGVPAYVNASQKVSGSTQLTQFSTFLTAMMAHVAGNNRCFGYFSLWNEVNQPSAFWTGTAAEMAALSAAAYPIIKAACPKTVVLSASTTSGVDNTSSPKPNGPFQYLNAYLAACASGCFDAVNVHGYPQVPSLQTANTGVMYAPELLANTIANARAVATANGFSPSIYLDEGYACSDPASVSIPANTSAYAACQGTQLVIAAFASVQSYANSFFGAGCVNQTACGNEYRSGAPLKLTTWGLAKRNMIAWFSGASVATPFARTVGTNLITSAPNAGSVATGSLGGTGTGCTSPPAGTGSLPIGASPWALSATASIAGGMSYYVVGTGSAPSIDVRICGTDASGANSDSIRMNNFTGAATQGQHVVIAACLGLAAGTLGGIQEIDLQINEYTSAPAYAGEFMVQSQIQPVATSLVPVTSQCFQTRYTMKAATAAFAVPYILIKHYGSVAIDATFRIGIPRLDVNATRWSGTITKAGGYTATIAEDASGSGSITAPAGTVNWRDVFGNVHKASAGDTIPLTGAPVLIESAPQKAWLPALTAAPGFFVAPTMGGSDGNPGTKTQPFATLNKCHTAMQASALRLCYVRGPVTAVGWTQGSNEFWRNYPGDAPAAITITGSTVQNIGCTSCSNIHVYGLTIIGAGTGGSLFGYFGPSLSNIFIQDDIVSVTGNEQIGSIFNWSNFRIQGNTFTSPSTNGLDQLSIVINDGIAHDSLYVTDNIFNNLARIQLEILDLSSQTLTNVYVDRNVFQGTISGGAIEAVTVAGASTAAENHNSVNGNTVTFPSGNNFVLGGFEMAIGGVTVSNNEFDYPAFPVAGITGAPGSAYFSNTIKIALSNTASNPSGPASFSPAQSPFYQGNEWIGDNTIVGSTGSHVVTGCSGGGTPPVAPGYCSLGHGPYGSPPTFWPPSPVWNQ